MPVNRASVSPPKTIASPSAISFSIATHCADAWPPASAPARFGSPRRECGRHGRWTSRPGYVLRGIKVRRPISWCGSPSSGRRREAGVARLLLLLVLLPSGMARILVDPQHRAGRPKLGRIGRPKADVEPFVESACGRPR